MRKLLESSGVALAGLTTSVLTALLIAVIETWTGVNVFTFSIWFVLPAGAVGCGFVAASGYFLGAKLLHKGASRQLLFQMVAIAALTQLLIYWLEYLMLVVDGVRIANMMPFTRYLDFSLTAARIQFGGFPASPVVGSYGYFFAVLDFIGFMIGGAAVYLYVGQQPKCPDCRKYLKALAKKSDRFEDFEKFQSYSDQVYAHPVDSAEFALVMGVSHKAKRSGAGGISQTTTLFECPQCNRQSILEAVRVFDGRQWQDAVQLRRFLSMPQGTHVRSAFNKRTDA